MKYNTAFRWLFCGMMTCLMGKVIANTDQADYPADHNALHTRIDTLMKEHHVPGISYAIFNRDSVLFNHAIGVANVATRENITPHTRLRIGSVTKVFTALAVLRAIDSGKIALTTPIKTVLTDLPLDNPYENSTPVRVIHLLEHTAGIDDMQLRSVYRPQEDRGSLMQVIAQDAKSLRVRWQPGTQMSYSNAGYTVLGVLLEKIYGKSWETIIHEQILTPLQLRETLTSNAAATQVEHAMGYTDESPRETGFPSLWHRPAGAIWSTAHDLAELGRFLMSDGTSHAGVISTELLRDMRRVHTTNAANAGLNWGYGLGLYQQEFSGLPMHGHNGAVDGFAANVFFSPDFQIGFAEIHNSDMVIMKFSRVFAGYLQMQNRDNPIVPDATVAATDANVAALSGWYRVANTRNALMRGADYLLSVMQLNWQDQQLQMKPLTGEAQLFHYVGRDRWRDSESKKANTVVIRDSNQQVIAIDSDGSYLERISLFSAFAPPILLVLALLALLTAPFGRRRALTSRWPRRWNSLAVLSLGLLVAGLSLLEGIGSAATLSRGPILIFIATLLLPLTAIAGTYSIARVWHNERATVAKWRSAAGAAGALALSIYFACFGWLGLGLWWN